MITETEILTSSDGHIVKEIETVRPLNNKELEERLYELTEIVKELATALYPCAGENSVKNWMERLDKLQGDFS